MTIAPSGRTTAGPLLALTLLCLAACGGSPKNKAPIPQSLTVGAEGDFTGHIVEVSVGVTYITTANVPMQAGDDAGNNRKRGFIRFDLSGVPAGALVQDATMHLSQVAPTGTPYVQLGGSLRVDHVNVGAALDMDDFSGNSLGIDIGTVSMDATLEIKMLGVGPQVALDLAAGRVTSDFRFGFDTPTDNGSDDDWAEFIAANFIGGPTLELNLLVPPP